LSHRLLSATRRPRAFARAAALALGGATLAMTLAATPARAQEGTRAAALAARNESLRRELELAGGDAFYLLLDAQPPVLRLMYRGAPLRETSIVAAELGEPRAGRGAEADRPVDLYAVWSGGTLEPPRVDVREHVVPPPVGSEDAAADVAADGAGAEQGEFIDSDEAGEDGAAAAPVEEEVEIPKTPEELYPVPATYEIRFQEGLTIEVVRAPEDAAAGEELGKTSGEAKRVAVAQAAANPAPESSEPGFWDRLQRVARRLSLSRPECEKVRLRLELSSRDADRLFRSLPPDVKLLIRRAAPQS
jgi:hypothetical protein